MVWGAKTFSIISENGQNSDTQHDIFSVILNVIGLLRCYVLGVVVVSVIMLGVNIWELLCWFAVMLGILDPAFDTYYTPKTANL